LQDLWSSPGLLHDIFFFGGGLLPPDGILARAKFTLRPSLAFSYIGSVILHDTPAAGLSQTLRCGTKEWNYGTFAEGATYIRLGGHHVGHRPTF